MNKVEQTKDGRIYIISETRYPSVTTILGQAKRERMSKDPKFEQMMQEAGDFGSQFHEYTMELDKGQSIEKINVDDPVSMVMLCSWADWVKRHIKHWILIEEVVWSHVLRVAGRLDRVGIFRGDKNPCLIDIKTGSENRDDEKQQWVYKRAVKESKGITVGRCLLAYVSRQNPGIVRIKECNMRREAADIKEFGEMVGDFYNARGDKI